MIQSWDVAARTKKYKMPKSMLVCDIFFPKLMTLFADRLALPLTNIYNKIPVSMMWPLIWKHESVTAIPKTSHPSDFGDFGTFSLSALVIYNFKLKLKNSRSCS